MTTSSFARRPHGLAGTSALGRGSRREPPGARDGLAQFPGESLLLTYLDHLDSTGRYALSVGLVVTCIGLGHLFESVPGAPAWTTLSLAVVVSSLIGGRAAGLMATGLGAFASLVLWGVPGLDPMDQRSALMRMSVFVVAGALASLAGGALHRARREAREAARRVRVMADNAPVLMWTASPDLRFTWLNQQWLDFTGRDLDHVLGDGWQQDVHPDDLRECLDTFRLAVGSRQPLETDYRLRRADGAYRRVEARGTPLFDEAGIFSGYIGSCIDIHDRWEAQRERERLLENERLARAEAERASRAQEEFLGIVSHELRAPLNAIVGWTHLLKSRLEASPEARAAVAVIERNALVQARIVDDLLDLNCFMSGTLSLDGAPVDVTEMVRRAVASAASSASQQAITVSTSVPDHAVLVSGDEQRLEQAVLNLLSNALKFTPEGGHVRVSVELRGERVVIAVDDTGDGIAPDFLPFVFDRFRQADGSRTRRHGGLGVGLAMTQAIVHRHGGTVSAESAGLGRGARFAISLPVARSDGERSASPAPGDERSLASIAVMVVDDDNDTCELLQRLLEDFGARVSTFHSVRDALLAWETSRPQVLVSDVSMPEEDGYSLVRTIRHKSPEQGGAVPAIALTAFGRAEDRRAAFTAGFQVHLRKPVDPLGLVDAIASLAKGA